MEKTAKNLATAFIGESQARNRYTIYAKAAKKEGYEQLAALFEETAEQEREHAKWLMRMLNDIKSDKKPVIVPEAEVPMIVGTSEENLQAAIAGENHEYTSMYPEFADTAEEERLELVAGRLRSIAKAEEHHEERYKKYLEQLQQGTVFKKKEEKSWVCRKCGYVHTGPEAPEACPSCSHPRAYYQLKCEEY